jgi:dienelactone hydrolase
LHVSDVRYGAEGREMVGFLAFDDEKAGARPAVLVSHEGPGLGRHSRDVAKRLAGLGYVAFALDYHGGGELLAMPEAMDRLNQLIADPSQTGRLALAGSTYFFLLPWQIRNALRPSVTASAASFHWSSPVRVPT